MKSVVLAIAAALVLIALPAAAQYDNSASTSQPTATDTATTNNLNTTDTTATTTTTTTVDTAGGAPVQEERTNPAVPTHSPNSGLTASGSVASWNDDEVVLRTATGVTHFKLLPATTGMRTFTEGQRVTIDFDRNEQGVLIAKQIRLEGETTTTTTTMGAAQAGAAVSEAASNVGEAVEEGVEETVGADVDNDNQIGTRGGTASGNTASTTTTTESTTSVDTTSNLPATGSNAPLFGLLGLLALGGAAALRRV